MPIRKPPCKRECGFRTEECHKNCDQYKEYLKLVEKDRELKLDYQKAHSSWTLARSQSFKRSEKYQHKKSQGVKI